MKKSDLLGVTSALFLSLIITTESFGQVTFNKRATGAIGVAPQPGNLSNEASLDNVNFQSGTLQIGIPLYTIKVGDINVPISLNYNSLGLKPGQAPGCVGLGWDLNAGGKIVTTVNGIPDTDPNLGLGKTNNPNILASPNMTNENSFDMTNNSEHRLFGLNVINNKKDGAWDVYNYSLPNGGGKYMVTGGNNLTFPFNPLITINGATSISTGDGLTYNFSEGDKFRNQKRNFRKKRTNYPNDVFYSDEWNPSEPMYNNYDLSKITSKWTKDTVLFDYQRITATGSQTDIISLSQRQITTTSVTMPIAKDVIETSGLWTNVSDNYYLKEPAYAQTQSNLMEHTRLSVINFRNGRVRFLYDPVVNGQDNLNTIIVEQRSGNTYLPLRKFVFYYVQNTNNLYLKNLEVLDENGQKVNGWVFDYAGYLPLAWNSQTKAVDRWGFYNGKTDNQTWIESPAKSLSLSSTPHGFIYNVGNSDYTNPQLSRKTEESRLLTLGNAYSSNVPLLIPFANKDFVYSEAIKGTLKSITTSTGATVIYDYEPHKFKHYKRDYGSTQLQDMEGGGIRIKSITFKDPLSETYTKKEYKYGRAPSDQDSGFGIVAYPLDFLKSLGVYGANNVSVENLVMFSNAMNDMDLAGGSYGAYGYVSEYIVKDSTVISGRYHSRTSYEYMPPNNSPWTSESSGTMPGFSHNSYGVSPENTYTRPVSITKFKCLTGGSFAKVEEVLNTYYPPIKAPAPADRRKSWSYFGSIAGTLYSQYTTMDLSVCITQQAAGGGQVVNCTAAERIPVSLDPIYWTNFLDEEPQSYFVGKYIGGIVDVATFSTCIRQKESRIITYETDGAPMDTIVNKFYYDNMLHLLPNRVASVNSQGDSVIQRTYYPADYSQSYHNYDAFRIGIDGLRAARIMDLPIEQVNTVKRNNLEYVVDAVYDLYGPWEEGRYPYKWNTNKLKSGTLLPFTSYQSWKDPKFEVKEEYSYNNLGGLTYVRNPVGPVTSYIYGYKGQYPVAQIKNGSEDTVTYCGFDGVDTSYYKGYAVKYNLAAIVNTSTPGGKAAYNLSVGNITRDWLGDTTTYVLSYWYKNTGSVNITGYIYDFDYVTNIGTYVPAGTVGAAKILKVKDGWTLVERQLNGIEYVTFTGNTLIDEIRIHPIDVQMTTYTYNAIGQITSSTDQKGYTVYYEYDSFQRLMNVKDEDGNILKHTEYRYKSL